MLRLRAGGPAGFQAPGALIAKCPSCDQPVLDGSEVCLECGAALYRRSYTLRYEVERYHRILKRNALALGALSVPAILSETVFWNWIQSDPSRDRFATLQSVVFTCLAAVLAPIVGLNAAHTRVTRARERAALDEQEAP